MEKAQLVRAQNLLSAYRQTDKKYNFGHSDLTAKWIVNNIFTKPCTHCGESDWHKLGCNRIDNSKPHTMDNVEPCCCKCNRRLPRPNARKHKCRKKDRIIKYEQYENEFVDKLKYSISIFNSIAEAYVY